MQETWLPRPATHRRWFAAAITLIGVAAIVAFLSPRASSFSTAHWSFTYGDGLRKRALVGSALRAVVGERTVTQEAVAILGAVLVLVVLAGIARLALAAWDHAPDLHTVVTAVALVLSPASLRYMGYEIGRFDPIGLTILLLGLLLLRNGWTWTRLVVVGALGGVAVAVHESFAVAFLPVLVVAVAIAGPADRDPEPQASPNDAAAIERFIGPRAMRFALAIALVPACVVLVWVSGGSIEEATARELADTVRSRAGMERDFGSDAAALVHARSLGDNVTYAWARVTARGPGVLAGGLLVMLPSAAVAWWSLRSAAGARRLRSGRWWLAGSALAPLGLAIVGEDWGRWMALATTNLLVVALWVRSLPRPEGGDGVARETAMHPWVILAVTISALLPPPRFSGAVPAFETATEVLRRGLGLFG